MFSSFKLFISLFCLSTCVNSLVRPELVDKPNKFLNSIHSNDIYDIKDAAPWAEEYKKCFKGFEDKTISTFAGDIFSPAPQARFARGEQFGSLFKVMKLDAAGVGNHEFDFNVDQFLKLNKMYGVDWVLSNVFKVPDRNPHTAEETTELLNVMKEYKIIERNGFKIGFFGLFDKDSYFGSRLTRTDLDYEDPVKAAVRVSKKLRGLGCDLVILLSHIVNQSDVDVLNGAENEIDLTFGGHNHEFRVQTVNNRLLLKSGHDFIDFSRSKIWFSKTPVKNPSDVNGEYNWVSDKNNEAAGPKTFNFSFKKAGDVYLNIEIERIYVDKTGKKEKSVDDEYQKGIAAKMTALTTSIAFYVNQKQNLADYPKNPFDLPVFRFVVDAMRAIEGSEFSMINVGGFRLTTPLDKDAVVTELILNGIIPYDDDMVVLKVPGSKLKDIAQEWLNVPEKNSVLAGLTFNYKKVGEVKTLIESSLKINGQNVDQNRVYDMITTFFYSQGAEIPTLKNCQTEKRILKGLNEYNVVMKFMDLLKNEKYVKEFECFKINYSALRSDSVIRQFKEPSKSRKYADFCEAGKANVGKTLKKGNLLFDQVTTEVLSRLVIYSMMEGLQSGKGKEKYFKLDLARFEVPVNEDKIRI